MLPKVLLRPESSKIIRPRSTNRKMASVRWPKHVEMILVSATVMRVRSLLVWRAVVSEGDEKSEKIFLIR